MASASAATSGSTTVVVSASGPNPNGGNYYTDSGVYIADRRSITVTATGSWNLGASYTSGPSGRVGETFGPSSAVPNGPIGALIGSRDGGVTWFLIGAGPTTVSGPGRLLLASNDAFLSGCGDIRGGCWRDNTGDLSVTITLVNNAPTVTVGGVTEGAAYEIGAVPAATCSVSDTEDGASSATPVITGALSHGLGQQTATCDATDVDGKAAATTSATYSIVDTGNPAISASNSPAVADGTNGWYTQPVGVDFTCSDTGGSGIASCIGDTTLSTDGADQSASGLATDWAANTAAASSDPVKIDQHAPTSIQFGGVQNQIFGDSALAPTCTADDATSGVDSCVVTGLSTSVGSHTLTATATDRAGNQSTAQTSYTVAPWSLRGFSQPTDMGGTLNTVKGGSTVPLKFEVFKGSTELSGLDAVKSLTASKITCTGAPVDDVELVTTGGTSLRYDATGGQFIQNWQTPKTVGTCYKVTMTAQDDSSISALFKTK